MKEEEIETELMECPFCGEEDFDKEGLKNHLLCYCKIFSETETLE